MSSSSCLGYAGNILRVDLSNQKISNETPDPSTLRQYLGGTGLGMKILYDEVLPGVEWNSPGNRLIFATGPINGTKIMGSGTFSVITKGAMTNGATSTQAGGFMGAFMKMAGFDALVVEGQSDHWVYLYLHGGVAELRDAGHLVGKGTFETEEIIKKELGASKRGVSVFIGPAGENLVRFACIVGDGGHVAAHNGTGAVMGSKRLKAIVASRQPAGKIEIHDSEKLYALGNEVYESIKDYYWQPNVGPKPMAEAGMLPIKNLTTNEIPEDVYKFQRTYYLEPFHAKPEPCWACRLKHCHKVKVWEGPYKGFIGEEPDYEQWACFGTNIGVSDLGAVVMLSSEVDDLGMDLNESGWITSLLMECYEKGIYTKTDLDGLDMKWGNAEAVKVLLNKLACREGIGDVFADGVKEAAQKLGSPISEMGVYTLKGTVPRGHDDRGNWQWLLDHSTSSTGVTETMLGTNLKTPDYPLEVDPFNYKEVAKLLGNRKGFVQLNDSLVLCNFPAGRFLEPLVQMVGAVTGWEFTNEEALQLGRRIALLMKAFDIRHGLGIELDMPSPRYGSQQVDGPKKAQSILPNWSEIRRSYYEALGWDKETGKPLPETLKSLGLEHVISDIWS